MSASQSVIRVSVFQYEIVWQDKPANFSRVEALVASAAPPAGSMLVLPEMFATGFSMDVGAVAEARDGPTTSFLSSLARQWSCFVVAGTVSEAGNGLGSNDAVVFAPDGCRVLTYRKMHPFSYGGESEHYAAGSDVGLFEWQGLKVCPLVCYDLRFPEVFRTAVTRGAQVFTVLANWPRARQAHWETLLRARAIENQAFVIGVNRIGRDPTVKYRGGSVVIDPRGEVLAQGSDEETVLKAILDTSDLDGYRNRFPALRDLHRDWVHP
jgi:predicted amidohydrolase